MTAFFAALYSYDGFDILNFGVEDVDRVDKTMPFAIAVGMSAVTLLFLLVNLSFFAVLSLAEIESSSAVAEVFRFNIGRQ